MCTHRNILVGMGLVRLPCDLLAKNVDMTLSCTKRALGRRTTGLIDPKSVTDRPGWEGVVYFKRDRDKLHGSEGEIRMVRRAHDHGGHENDELGARTQGADDSGLQTPEGLLVGTETTLILCI